MRMHIIYLIIKFGHYNNYIHRCMELWFCALLCNHIDTKISNDIKMKV